MGAPVVGDIRIIFCEGASSPVVLLFYSAGKYCRSPNMSYKLTTVTVEDVNREHALVPSCGDEAAQEINHQHALVGSYGQEMLATEPGQRSINAAIRCGELLQAKKIELPRGGFDSWVESHCEFSRASAYNYIKISKRLTALDGQALRHLFPSGRSKRALPPAHKPDELIETLSRLTKLYRDKPDDTNAMIAAIDDACARLNEFKERLQDDENQARFK
jgi:hypothetical protein